MHSPGVSFCWCFPPIKLVLGSPGCVACYHKETTFDEMQHARISHNPGKLAVCACDDNNTPTGCTSSTLDTMMPTAEPSVQRSTDGCNKELEHTEAIEPEKAHERRLTQLQLERFRRSMINTGRTNRHSIRPRVSSMLNHNLGLSSKRELRVNDYPWSYWLVGLVITVGAVIVVAASDYIDWRWRLTLGVAMGLIASGFVLSGRIESLVMNKDSGTLVLRSAKPTWVFQHSERRIEHELRCISNIRVIASGELTGSVNTRSYKISVEFVDGTRLSALESQCEFTTRLRCGEIRAFLFEFLEGTRRVEDGTSTGTDASRQPRLLHHATSLPSTGATATINRNLSCPPPSTPSSEFPLQASTGSSAKSLPTEVWAGRRQSANAALAQKEHPVAGRER